MRMRVKVKNEEKIVHVYGQSYKTSNSGKLIHEVMFYPRDMPAFVHDRQLSKEQQKLFNQIKRQTVKQIIQNPDQFFNGFKSLRVAVSE